AMRPPLPLLLLLGAVALGQPRDASPAGAQCLEHECFAVFWDARPFSAASEGCERGGGHLMTVRSTVAEEAIALLLQNRAGRLWLGLALPPDLSCTEPDQRLRGFRWVTGDRSTDYTNWAPSGQRCGERCVTVSRELRWEERSCEEPADGFLCQYSYGGSCPRLAAPPGVLVTYATPFGARGAEFLALPPRSVAFIPDFGLELRCDEDGDSAGPRWGRDTPGAWPCEVAGGGCAGTCAGERGRPRCSCAEGAVLGADGRGCRSLCEGSPCQHHCVVAGGSFVCMCFVGYRLAADGAGCEDIDDCASEPGPCEQQCVNTQGGFQCHCHSGYTMVDGHCQPRPPCLEAQCQQLCEELPHGYRCACRSGYAVHPQDATRCRLHCNATECPAVCDAGGTCLCPEGFVLDGDQCVDVDECDSNYCPFNCTNTPGGYQCHCPPGQHLRDNDCVPILGGDGEEAFSGDWEPLPHTPVPSRSPPSPERLHPGLLVAIAAGALLSLLALLALGLHLARKRCRSRGSMDYKYSGPQEKELGLQPVPSAQKP
ncbi:TRBM protein, partial [Pachycephala philippinensis]|nr:TRBM protein [Pachycephala philippinensis]